MSSPRGAGEYLRAVIYVIADGNEDRWQRQCIRWCERQRYEVVSLVIDTPAAPRWPDAFAMLSNGEASVIVAPNWDHLPADRLPRAEVVGTDAVPSIPRQRRAREVRQNVIPPRQRDGRRGGTFSSGSVLSWALRRWGAR